MLVRSGYRILLPADASQNRGAKYDNSPPWRGLPAGQPPGLLAARPACARDDAGRCLSVDLATAAQPGRHTATPTRDWHVDICAQAHTVGRRAQPPPGDPTHVTGGRLGDVAVRAF